MNEEIKNILSNLIINNIEIEVSHIKYDGRSKTYVLWTIINEEPLIAYDDEIQYSKTTIDIDIYSNGNFLNIVKEIKKRFKNNDWIWVEDNTENYNEESKLYHKTISFEKEMKIQWQEKD